MINRRTLLGAFSAGIGVAWLGSRSEAQPLALRIWDVHSHLHRVPGDTPEERMEIYDRLNQLVPAPAGVTRDAMQYWTYRTTDKWWPDILKASGVNALKKKKRMPRGL